MKTRGRETINQSKIERKYAKLYITKKYWGEGVRTGFEHLLKLSITSPSLSPPIPSFGGIHKVRKFLLNLSMKCSNSAFYAQCLRLIIVVVQVEAVNM
jgi:hypothetical protein